MRSNPDRYALGRGTWRGAQLTHTNNYISKHGADRSNITDHIKTDCLVNMMIINF